MDIGIISVRYARALLQYAIGRGEAETVYKEFSALARTYLGLPKLQAAVQSPVVTSAQKATLLKGASVRNGRLTVSTERFIDLVVAHQRADLIVFIANAYLSLYRKYSHIMEARLITPIEVDESIRQRVKKLLESRIGSHVDIDATQDPSLGGGFIIEYDTYRLDASLAAQFKRLRRSLIKQE